MRITPEQITAAVDGLRSTVEDIFEGLAAGTRDPNGGITRASYSEQENYVHAFLADIARNYGFEVSEDASANTYMTLTGLDRKAPQIVIGSHLDSVKQGGNYDGAAGVVSGLVALMVLSKLGIKPKFDISAMGVRAEESTWFQVSYIGSRGALGQLPEGALDVLRVDTQRSLRDHIHECGGDPQALERGDTHLSTHNVRAYIEPHIEQAPKLVLEKIPVAICLAIPGNFRYAEAKVIGEYGHVGTPKQYRHDAAMAAADLAMSLDKEWEEQLAKRRQMAITMGRFHTDSNLHGMTTIAGEFNFSLDIRGYQQDLLDHMEARLAEIIHRIEVQRNVRFELGPKRSAKIGDMDQNMSQSLEQCANELGIHFTHMYSPASHDAAAFAAAGIPTGMIMIRNDGGSHNPDEQMSTDDFLESLKILVAWLIKESGKT